MLLELAQWLSKDYRFFSVFNYITLRAVLATLTALLVGLMAGPWLIRKLAELKIGQAVRSDGPQTHLSKAGTPTMGGALILIGIGIATILWADLSNRFVWAVLLVTLGFGAVGWIDDYRKVVHKNPKGMSARSKFFWQSVIGLLAAVYLAFAVPAASNQQAIQLVTEWFASGFAMSLPPRADLIVPFFKSVSYPLGVFGFIALSYLVIVGTSNAVNLTDGADGLAILPAVLVGSALGVFAYVTGNAVFARYLLIPFVPGAGEMVVFCGAIAGAGLAFLWFNAYPAQVFMGDVGSLSLGGGLGVCAVVTKNELLSIVLGGIFFLEACSVIIQVVSFKTTGKRVFLMAPIHHHFEKKGWPEPKVIVRFWIVSVLLALLALSSLKLR